MGQTILLPLEVTALHMDSSQNKIWHDLRSTSAVSLSDDTWHHVALVVKPILQTTWSTSVFLDGSPVNMSEVNATDAANTDSYYDSSMAFQVAKYSTTHEQFDINEIGYGALILATVRWLRSTTKE